MKGLKDAKSVNLSSVFIHLSIYLNDSRFLACIYNQNERSVDTDQLASVKTPDLDIRCFKTR